MRFPNLPVTSFEDTTHDFEALQVLLNTTGVSAVSMPTRVLGTAYQPNLTRPTLVSMVILTSASGSGAQFFSDAANPPTTERTRTYNGGASGTQLGMTALVLPGHYYSAGAIGSASVLETAEWTLPSTALTTTVNTVAVPLTGSAWITPTLTNSWANFGSGFETAGYLKDPLGFVHLKGVLTGGANGTTAWVLPAGFRPGATTDHSPQASTVGAAVQIGTSGLVAIAYTGAPAAIGLSGVTFLAEN